MALPNKDILSTYGVGVGVVLSIAGFVAAYWFIEPAPPRALTMATGSKGGAYYDIGRRYKELSLPEGALDLESNIPENELDLLATTASLVAQESLHPALVSLLLQAAEEIHYGGGLIDPAGKFPSPQFIELPLSEDAARFYQHGPPFLQQYLPFWAAVVVDRLKIMLIPMAGLLYPLFRMMPPLYRWRVRSRVYRWYSELEAVDPTFSGGRLPHSLQHCLGVLDRIEQEATRAEVPPSYAQELYILLSNVEGLRRKLTARADLAAPTHDDSDRSSWKP